MSMEQRVWSKCERNLSLCTNSPSKPPRLEALASARSLIVNPSTSDDTISSLFETLARSLQHDQAPLFLRHVLKLLSDLALRRKHLSRVVFNTIHTHALVIKDATRLTAQALAVLLAITEHDRSSSSAIGELNQDLVISLCFRPHVSVRTWVLLNAERFCIRPWLLVTLLLGFMKDPYPHVRRAALIGLVGLSKSVDIEGRGLIEGCYDRAVELLIDMEEYVRSAAVRVVSEWGQMVVASDHEVDKRDCSDAVFVQLCSMVRDMCVEVRVEAFVALGKVRLVSEDILLQTLSKKVLGSMKEKKFLGRRTAKEFDLPASSAAGTFIHGLEDEFYEVRRSACLSIGMLTIFSVQFANDVLNLLMDLLNDDSTVVRLQTLETMYHMATCDRLNVQETHMHMFLGILVDNSILIRCAAKKNLRLMKLPVLEMFKSVVDSLLTNLETYPQDDADVFTALFNIGRSHGNFAVCFMKEFAQEMEPSCEGELSLDSVRVTALLVLAISASLSHEHLVCQIPPRVFSYSVPLLGRISRSFRDVMSQDTLLAYLSYCSRSIAYPATELNFRRDGPVLPVVESGILNNNNNERINPVWMPLRQISDGTSKIQFQNMRDPMQVAIPLEEYRQKVNEEATNSLKFILGTVTKTWPLIQSGCTSEVLRTLRACKEELATITMDSLVSVGSLAFASQYLRVTQLLAKVWEHFLPRRMLRSYGKGALDLLLEKLDRSLRGMMYMFLGLSEEEELLVLELILLTCVLRLSVIDICSHLTILKRLCATISRVEVLCKKVSIEPSNFVRELEKSCCQMSPSFDEASYNPFLFKKLLEIFSLKEVVFSGRLVLIKAELGVPGNDSENPLPFIAGLPVGITFEIILHNISSENRLWLRMAVEEFSQYVFLDLNHFKGCDEVRKITFCAPFYRTPKAISFSLSACIGIECLYEDIHLVKGGGGPKHELTYLCKEKAVYLVQGY